MEQNERLNSPQLMTQAALDGHQAQIWTMLPGIIHSYNPATQTAQVQPALKGKVTAPDGSTSHVNLPLIPDVPVHFPGGGGATMTFPIAPGDECVLHFASRSIDAWYASGGVQPPLDSRMHDLSDAIAHVGVRSQARKLAGVSATTTQLRSDDGRTVVELDATGGVLKLTAPTGITLDTPMVTLTGGLQAALDVVAGTVSLQHHTHSDPQGGNTGAPAA